MSWPLVKIGDFCITGSGGTPSRTKSEYFEGDIPWIKSGDLRENIVINATEFISKEAVKNSSAKMVTKGSILLAMYGATVGRMALLGIDATTNQAVCNITPDSNIAFTKYVYYALLSKVPEFLKNAVGGAQPNISQGIIRETQIPLPPLAEQKRIAAILDKADAIRRKRQQAIKLADEFLRSVFLDMFGDPVTNPKGWEVRSLGCVIERGPTNGLYKHANEYGSGTRILRIDGFYDGVMLDDTYFKRVILTESEQQKFLLVNRSVVINRVNSREYLGKSAYVENLQEPTVFESNIMNLTVQESILNPVFLVAQLQMPNIKMQILNSAKDAVNQSSINQQDVKALQIMIPDIDLQNRFESFTKKFKDSRKVHLTSIERINCLFSSLSQQALSGSL